MYSQKISHEQVTQIQLAALQMTISYYYYYYYYCKICKCFSSHIAYSLAYRFVINAEHSEQNVSD